MKLQLDRSLLKSNWLKAGVLVCTLVLILWVLIEYDSRSFEKVDLNEMVIDEVESYSLSNIPQIELVEASVGQTELMVNNYAKSTVRAAILPHHTLIGDKLDEYWAQIALRSKPERIVVVGPAHWDQGKAAVKTTDVGWATGGIEVVEDVEDLDIALEQNSFIDEHSVGIHMPYIAHYFEDVPVVPVIAQSRAGSRYAYEFVEKLAQMEEDILVIFSIDFAHYLSADQSMKNDRITQELIQQRNFDQIDVLGPDFFDSSFSLAAYMHFQELTGCRSSQKWHEHNSNLHPGIRDDQGTSYFVFFCSEPSDIIVAAVGDVMLTRSVGNALNSQTNIIESRIEESKLLINEYSEGSDIVFSNLDLSSFISASTF